MEMGIMQRKGSANEPAYKGDKVYFDGSDDYLRIPISNGDELDVSNKSFTAFLIYKPISKFKYNRTNK